MPKQLPQRKTAKKSDQLADALSITEEERIKIAEKHLTALTKLLGLPLPLICAVMIALGAAKDVVKVFDLEIPRDYAEFVARAAVLLILVQACVHLSTLLAIVWHTRDSSKLQREFGFHAGPFNPFFSINTRVPRPELRPLRLFGLTSRLSVGFMLGFAGGFRPSYASGLVSHWYRLGSYVAWPFSRPLYEHWSSRSKDIVQYYVHHKPFAPIFDFFLLVPNIALSLGVIAAIAVIAYRLSNEERAIAVGVQLVLASFCGWLIAIILSNAIRMAEGIS